MLLMRGWVTDTHAFIVLLSHLITVHSAKRSNENNLPETWLRENMLYNNTGTNSGSIPLTWLDLIFDHQHSMNYMHMWILPIFYFQPKWKSDTCFSGDVKVEGGNGRLWVKIPWPKIVFSPLLSYNKMPFQYLFGALSLLLWFQPLS